jgi:hypothetical protein
VLTTMASYGPGLFQRARVELLIRFGNAGWTTACCRAAAGPRSLALPAGQVGLPSNNSVQVDPGDLASDAGPLAGVTRDNHGGQIWAGAVRPVVPDACQNGRGIAVTHGQSQ